jgi:Gpi18-like mannosyltransferase
VWLIRFAGNAGFELPRCRAVSFITKDFPKKSSPEVISKKEYLQIFIYALLFRILIFLAAWLARGIFQSEKIPSFLDYCGSWNLWDAPHYIDIASKGYAGSAENGEYLFLVFFPLYPLLIRLFHFVIPNYVLSALTVSTLCYGVGCMIAYRLISIDYSKRTSKKSLVLLSIYPFAFFFGGIMTESLFFMLIMAVFLAIRKHNWLAVGILGALASLSRSFGIFMIIPAFAEWVQTERPVTLVKEKQFKELWKRILAFLPVFITVFGILIYLYINYRTAGDAFIFIKYDKEHWYQELQFFGKTLRMLWDRTMSFNDSWTNISSLFMPELAALPIFALIILYSARRERSMYVVFMLVYFAFNAGASWPLSLSRYLSCMFPVFWIIADFTDKHKKFELPVTAIFAVLFGIYLTGYITGHSIM